MKRFFSVFLGIVFLFGTALTSAAGTEYFVDSADGDDDADGKTSATAWRSLERVGAEKQLPGDVVRFRRDRVWRGTLRAQSGSPEAPVVYSDYGDGDLPRIMNSVDLSAPERWFPAGDGLWATAPAEKVKAPQIPADAPLLPEFANGVGGRWTTWAENGAKSQIAEAEFDGERGWT
ncbi:MAG: hypothetical protein HUK22_02055, partial [Thermoguttaceae bacterium]|nr:hypothetical protein [Thermoguttaceae bacterium]